MNIIRRTTKSEKRFNTMRTIYLGSEKKLNKITGRCGKRPDGYVSWGFNTALMNDPINALIEMPEVKDALLINDFTFEAVNWLIINKKLQHATVVFMVKDKEDKKNIANFIEDYFNEDDLAQLNIVYLYEHQYKHLQFRKNGLPLLDKDGNQKVKITKRWNYEDIINMSTNLVLSNPAYGKIGANITDVIIKYVDFDEFVNLLPANDIKRYGNETYNYIKEIKPVIDGFKGDASVTTHVAKMSKTKVNSMTLDEFERSIYTDPQLDKYFAENSKRSHYAIDAAGASDLYARNYSTLTAETICITNRDMNHKHLPYSKTNEYLFNTLTISLAEYLTKINQNRLACSRIKFDTEIEKRNFAAFIYSNNGFKFIAKVATAVNCDSAIMMGKVFPKVDWTRSWIVEEILNEYGYTQDEIEEVMKDLVNFKGMD